MFYYYAADRKIKPHVSQLIARENGHMMSSIEIEIFGHVDFEKQPRKEVIKRMSGKWFDLNGNTSRLFALLDMKTVADVRNERFEPIHLCDVAIHQQNFDADMGPIEFTR